MGAKKKRTYLIDFNHHEDDRDKVLDILNSEGLKTWRTELPGCIMLKTVNSAEDVSGLLRGKMNGKFLVAEISGNRQGMLSPDGWEFLKDTKGTEVVEPLSDKTNNDVERKGEGAD